MEPYKPPTSSRYSAPTATSPFSTGGPSQQMPTAFSSHNGSSRREGSSNNNSNSRGELPAAFSKSRERGSGGAKDGEWSAFGKRAVSPTAKKQGSGEPSAAAAAAAAQLLVPRNSILAHIEAALGGDIGGAQKSQEKWGQSALKRATTTAEKGIASAPAPAPEKAFEEQFPTLKAVPTAVKSDGAWGKQSMAEKMRQNLQEEEERKKKELETAEQKRLEAEKNKVHGFSAVVTGAFVYDTHPFKESFQYREDEYYDEGDEY